MNHDGWKAEHMQTNYWEIYDKDGNMRGKIITGKETYWADEFPRISKRRFKSAKAALIDFCLSHDIIELALCESEILILKPNVHYVFKVMPNCKRCKELAGESNGSN